MIDKVKALLEAEGFSTNFPLVDGRYILPVEGENNYLIEDLYDAGAIYEVNTGLWIIKNNS